MTRRAMAVSAVWLVAALAAPRADILEQVLVKVNGDIITKTDLEQRQVATLRQRDPNLQPSDEAALQKALAEITPGVIVDAVDELLILQRGRELGYAMSAEQFDSIVENIKKENKLEDEAQFQAALKQEGMTMADLRKQLERTMIIQRVQQTEIMGKLQVTDAELKMYYDSHRESFTTKPQLTLREILIAVPGSDRGVNVGLEEEAKGKADEIRTRLVAGEPFARLASDFSDSPSKANGGLVGPVTMDVLAPEFQEALKGLKAGELTPVVRTSRGYQIVKLETMETATVKPFEESRDEIADRIASEKRRGEFTKFLEKLRGQAIIDWKNEEIKKAWELGLKQQTAEATPSTR
ncbi:MAG: peptidylprolyl isomerase [Acidobacteria bacterium]|nr:peptidylprolyl isomerase [Acidobacteriota bacterium]